MSHKQTLSTFTYVPFSSNIFSTDCFCVLGLHNLQWNLISLQPNFLRWLLAKTKVQESESSLGGNPLEKGLSPLGPLNHPQASLEGATPIQVDFVRDSRTKSRRFAAPKASNSTIDYEEPKKFTALWSLCSLWFNNKYLFNHKAHKEHKESTKNFKLFCLS